MSILAAWLWACGGFIAGWVAQLFWDDRVRHRYLTPDQQEFVCEDCGRQVCRISGGFAPDSIQRRICLDCEMMPGWFLDAHLASALDPTCLARPRPDYVKGT